MKNLFKIVLFLTVLFFVSCGQEKQGELIATKEKVDLVDYVNPLMGTDSEFSLSNGNTYPAIALPWGMNFWTPMTSKMGDGWTYKYREHKIRGIKQTHQPSPWLNDYAAFSLMAVTGDLKYKEGERASWFSHKAEIVNPISTMFISLITMWLLRWLPRNVPPILNLPFRKRKMPTSF